MTATPSLRELAAVRNRYRELLGCPVAIEVRSRRLVIATGETLDAITMPADFGAQVLSGLRISLLAGPVIGGQERWTFLTLPARTVSPTVAANLRLLEVRPIPGGAHVVLPPVLDEPGIWSWVVPPTERQLSLWSAVMGTARRVAARLAAEITLAA